VIRPLRYLTTPTRRPRQEEIVKPPLFWIAVGVGLVLIPSCGLLVWVAEVLAATPCGVYVWP
jgi:hypothetical protein